MPHPRWPARRRTRHHVPPRAGLLAEGAPDDELRQTLARLGNDFRDKAPLSAAQAASGDEEGR
jgi:hypothetical protein